MNHDEYSPATCSASAPSPHAGRGPTRETGWDDSAPDRLFGRLRATRIASAPGTGPRDAADRPARCGAGRRTSLGMGGRCRRSASGLRGAWEGRCAGQSVPGAGPCRADRTPAGRRGRGGRNPSAGRPRDGSCDLIVMGTQRRTGLLGRLRGRRDREEVRREAPCPVLTLTTPAPRPQPAGGSVGESTGRSRASAGGIPGGETCSSSEPSFTRPTFPGRRVRFGLARPSPGVPAASWSSSTPRLPRLYGKAGTGRGRRGPGANDQVRPEGLGCDRCCWPATRPGNRQDDPGDDCDLIVMRTSGRTGLGG